MRNLIRLTAAASALVITLGSAACSGETPTTSATAPAGPRLDGGVTFGSGNVTGSGANNLAVDSASTATRGGSTFGSGN